MRAFCIIVSLATAAALPLSFLNSLPKPLSDLPVTGRLVCRWNNAPTTAKITLLQDTVAQGGQAILAERIHLGVLGTLPAIGLSASERQERRVEITPIGSTDMVFDKQTGVAPFTVGSLRPNVPSHLIEIVHRCTPSGAEAVALVRLQVERLSALLTSTALHLGNIALDKADRTVATANDIAVQLKATAARAEATAAAAAANAGASAGAAGAEVNEAAEAAVEKAQNIRGRLVCKWNNAPTIAKVYMVQDTLDNVLSWVPAIGLSAREYQERSVNLTPLGSVTVRLGAEAGVTPFTVRGLRPDVPACLLRIVHRCTPSKAQAVAVVRLETRALAALVKDAAVDLGDIALDSAADAVNSAAHIGAQIRYTAAQAQRRVDGEVEDAKHIHASASASADVDLD